MRDTPAQVPRRRADEPAPDHRRVQHHDAMEQPDVHGPKAPLTIPQVQALFGTLSVRW
ncbi:hypothetical protein GCM10022223_12930 [Kineosporia mesophila]|uniref:Uncharacterized protein n=1 Tax=Kineosporia mesophila TaxID=566012 RepID=A0ABP6Z7J6_9ACTN